VHVTDLEVLSTIVSNPKSDSLASNGDRIATSILLECLVPNIKDLTVSLRLPLRDYEVLQTDAGVVPRSTIWSQFPGAIKRMSKLRRLHIWLDHDEPTTWSQVNERAIFSSLQSLADIPNLTTSITLPKLHPQHENAEKHFMVGTSPLGMAIHRRYRQRYHSTDGMHVLYEPDFPILHEIADYWGISMAETEELERGEYSMGHDPLELVCGMVSGVELQCRINVV
jgi:hypothetical protein